MNNDENASTIRFGGRCDKHVCIKPCLKCFQEKVTPDKTSQSTSQLVINMKWILENSTDLNVKKVAFEALKSTSNQIDESQSVCSMGVGCTDYRCLAIQIDQGDSCPVKRQFTANTVEHSRLLFRLKGKIRVGAHVAQDRAYGKWPFEYNGVTLDPDMVFDIVSNSSRYECIADGHGRRSGLGQTGGYGNGPITVFSPGDIIFITDSEAANDTKV